MMGYGWLNLGSLVLGLIAWILPGINGTHDLRKGVLFSVVSFGACAVSLVMQIFYTDHLVKIGDFSALMDTSGAVAMVSALLIVVTVIINAITLSLCFPEK